MRALAMCAVLAAAGFLAADDKKDDKKPKGEDVAGTVTFNGKPVPGGTVTFTSKDGKTTAAGTTDDDGKYKATVPAGEYVLTVAAAKKGPKIPDKYGDPKTSGLTFIVKAGKQTCDLSLGI